MSKIVSNGKKHILAFYTNILFIFVCNNLFSFRHCCIHVLFACLYVYIPLLSSLKLLMDVMQQHQTVKEASVVIINNKTELKGKKCI